MANNKIAFGLCEQHNIKLPKDATPRDAWEALKKHGIDAGEHNSGKYYPTNSLEPYKRSRTIVKENKKHLVFTDKNSVDIFFFMTMINVVCSQSATVLTDNGKEI